VEQASRRWFFAKGVRKKKPLARFPKRLLSPSKYLYNVAGIPITVKPKITYFGAGENRDSQKFEVL
jgi:hypothetical protein